MCRLSGEGSDCDPRLPVPYLRYAGDHVLISGHPWPDRKLYLTLSPCIAPVLLRILDSSSIHSSGCYPSRCASNCPRSALQRPIPTPECPRGFSYRVFIPQSWTVIRIQITYASTVPTRMSPSLRNFDPFRDRNSNRRGRTLGSAPSRTIRCWHPSTGSPA